MAIVWMPLPDRDFDVTEVAVPWHTLTRAGHQIVFATERGGNIPEADPRLLTGVIFGQLGAEPEARDLYRLMVDTPAFRAPLAWSDINPAKFDGLLLSGGHAPGMKQYLESPMLQQKVSTFWGLDRPVGAICHGTVVLARSRDPVRASVLRPMRTTCLPQYMELTAWALTAWKLGSYYRTYPQTVEREVRQALADPRTQFVRGPLELLRKGTEVNDVPAFVCEDGRYLSARWPGDAYLYARKFLRLLTSRQ